MQWSLSEEQTAYRKALRDWLGDVAPADVVRSWLETGDSATFTSRFCEDGWCGVGVPEERGGQGGGMVELALTAEELARHAVPSAAWLATMVALPAMERHPRVLAHAVDGAGATLAVSAEAVVSAARPLTADADGRVSGTVPRVLAAGEVGALVVPVATDGGTVLVLVDPAGPGVRITPRSLLDRSRSVADVAFDAAPSTPLVEPADVAGPAEVLARAAARAAVLVAADSLGTSERMLDMAVAYSLQRHQFGVPIGSFQAVKHAAATILVGGEAARSVVYFAAASVQGGDPQALAHAAAAKAQVTAEGARAADSALTMHGAIGYTWEHDLQLFYKRAKLDAVLYGSPTAWNEILATHLLPIR
ncbi:Acyl-CoA dehydrogenase [Parafrankia irregularis]|uniref:Acyl-CoA dehydrogenase n=1 Tax=Parafrankia irregularis TaxID=795642 RepID=A0A0S4QXT8_9ACTN|nr:MULTISPECIES: acyl-CoA dehydrogenase family protein [Parafrankia]MBE3200302.1 acyl-CoA/acyl-ACP dehydrogenase [Parafrankia sp. CH37]CUU59708.1 Acyl-CoA dehydrogenase [Parafrankia irregularis]